MNPETNDDYEVLEFIGRGGYGEVFLARDKKGIFWAVKVVHRASFDHDRPFEREFGGISKFEAVSRLSESQLQILHVGRRDQAGYFYYIMELADDAARGREIRPGEYAPRTLQSNLKQRGRLPPIECCHLARDLSAALENLHAHRLVHRDIKPGNIIFVNSRPKLADPGLVTDADKSITCAGTEGYIPPEGPGSARADVYSLGIVLYESMTGSSRFEFPKLPEDFEQWPDHKLALELNRVINRACHANLRKRFQSARELTKALDAVLTGAGKKSGKPVLNLARGLLSRKTVPFVSIGLTALFLVGDRGPFHERPFRMRGRNRRPRPVAVPAPQLPSQPAWTNSLGMPFVRVPGTEVQFCIWKTRVRDFAQFVKATGYDATRGELSVRPYAGSPLGNSWSDPGFPQSDDCPVCGVSWDDAHAFCDWLTEHEQSDGTLGDNRYYRLPTDAEWSAAVGPGKYPWGDEWPPPPGLEITKDPSPGISVVRAAILFPITATITRGLHRLEVFAPTASAFTTLGVISGNCARTGIAKR